MLVEVNSRDRTKALAAARLFVKCVAHQLIRVLFALRFAWSERGALLNAAQLRAATLARSMIVVLEYFNFIWISNIEVFIIIIIAAAAATFRAGALNDRGVVVITAANCFIINNDGCCFDHARVGARD